MSLANEILSITEGFKNTLILHNKIARDLSNKGWKYDVKQDHFTHEKFPGHKMVLSHYTGHSMLYHQDNPSKNLDKYLGKHIRGEQALRYLKKLHKE